MSTVAMTGHRPPKLGLSYDPYSFTSQLVMNHMIAEWDRLGVERILSGMALGIDQIAAVAALRSGRPFEAAIPFVGQEHKWPRESQAKYQEILVQARTVQVISDGFSKAAFQKRNEWMVDRSHFLMAYWDGTPGGTANCVNYALDKKPIYHTLQERWLGSQRLASV